MYDFNSFQKLSIFDAQCARGASNLAIVFFFNVKHGWKWGFFVGGGNSTSSFVKLPVPTVSRLDFSSFPSASTILLPSLSALDSPQCWIFW